MSGVRFYRLRSKRCNRSAVSAQRGMTMLVALVVLLVMTITGLALVRTSTLGTGVAGSLALKQSATSGADLGLEQGLAALNTLSIAGGDKLDNNVSASGYYATVNPKLSTDQLPWESGSKKVTDDDGLGNEVRFMIHRLCTNTGRWNADGQACVMPPSTGCPGSTESVGSVATCNDRPMYRVTARAKGPRDTMSYVQMSTY